MDAVIPSRSHDPGGHATGPEATQLVFGIMSAGYSDAVVRQLVRSLQPAAVVVHHDFERYPGFRLDMPNAYLVPDPLRTGWGNWGFVSGIVRLLEYALDSFEFDYLQLLSPTCLPIRPVESLRRHLAENPADAHVDLVGLDDDPEALLEFAYRAFLPGGSLRQRVMLRVMALAQGRDPTRETRAGLCIARPSGDGFASRARFRAGLTLARAARAGLLGHTPFDASFRPYVSSTWFCANRTACRHVIDKARDPGLVAHYRNGRLIDEIFFASIIGNSGLRVGALNHLINDFDTHGHPRTLKLDDLDRLAASRRFFARKFRDDPADPARQRALAWAGVAASGEAGEPERATGVPSTPQSPLVESAE